VAAVAPSAAAPFGALADGEALAVVLEPTPSEDDPPIALATRSPRGEFVVRLSVRGTHWARLAFQFAHEYCHVLAGVETFTHDRFTWLEESLCETASLFALRAMARQWEADPPYPNWCDYAPSLARYAAERTAEPEHRLPPETAFATLLAARLPALEAEPTTTGGRAAAVVIATELLPVLEVHPAGWRAVRRLHAWTRAPSDGLAESISRWRDACSGPEARVVDEHGWRLGVRLRRRSYD
jgi:hypothetical protein